MCVWRTNTRTRDFIEAPLLLSAQVLFSDQSCYFGGFDEFLVNCSVWAGAWSSVYLVAPYDCVCMCVCVCAFVCVHVCVCVCTKFGVNYCWGRNQNISKQSMQVTAHLLFVNEIEFEVSLMRLARQLTYSWFFSLSLSLRQLLQQILYKLLAKL